MLYDVQPGDRRLATLEGAPSGHAVTFRVVDPTGADFLPTVAATETLPGTYTHEYILPNTEGNYLESWTDLTDPATIIEPDIVHVTWTRPVIGFVPSSEYYATPDDVRNYAPDLADRSDEELAPLIAKAEKDVDDYAAFGGTPDAVTGRKFDLTTQDTVTAAAINRAVCAQVAYRVHMGPVFFREQVQYTSVGGDISTDKASRYGPEMKMEFPSVLRKITGRMT